LLRRLAERLGGQLADRDVVVVGIRNDDVCLD
jgi:hypothetical protein